jgi:hypothetical protein
MKEDQAKNQVVQYISSAQAIWRCCKFQTYPSPLPSVSVIKIKIINFIIKLHIWNYISLEKWN